MVANSPQSFQDIILRLQNYWVAQGCALMQPTIWKLEQELFTLLHTKIVGPQTMVGSLCLSLLEGQLMVVMEIIQIGYSTIINFRY